MLGRSLKVVNQGMRVFVELQAQKVDLVLSVNAGDNPILSKRCPPDPSFLIQSSRRSKGLVVFLQLQRVGISTELLREVRILRGGQAEIRGKQVVEMGRVGK